MTGMALLTGQQPSGRRTNFACQYSDGVSGVDQVLAETLSAHFVATGAGSSAAMKRFRCLGRGCQ